MASILLDLLELDVDTRALIICCENLGTTSSANAGIYKALREGVATSASLVVPAPWARAAAAEYRGEDVGVSLTLIAECELLKWGPLTYAPSLLGGDGGFPSTIEDIWEHADLEEVRREWRAQIERAILWGFDVSHLSVHLPGIELRPEFFDAYLDLAEEFQLPIILSNIDVEKAAGFHFRSLATMRQIAFPDNCISVKKLPPTNGDVMLAMENFDLGINTVQLDVAIDTYELRTACSDWEEMVSNLALLTSRQIAEKIKTSGITLLNYKKLRDAMRK